MSERRQMSGAGPNRRRPIEVRAWRPEDDDFLRRSLIESMADWEIVTLGATTPGRGAGGALMDAVPARAAAAGARRVWSG